MIFKLNDREVEVSDYDFEMGEGVTVTDAVFLDNDVWLNENELEELTNKYQSELYEAAYENIAARAYDDAKDRMKYGE